MRILLIHNYYGSSAPSGENKVFEAEKAMLEKHGHAVAVYTRHSDEIRNGNAIARLWGKVKGALCTVGNPFAARAVAKLCREFKPDVVHFHNTFPLISPLTVRAASKYAPVVMTLHNYRTACAAGVPTRDGKVCSLCLDKKCVLDGVKHRCYRGSLFATLPLAINITLYRKWLSRWVGRFLVFSEFQRGRMVKYGLSYERISMKPNFIAAKDCEEKDRARLNQILYVGRLSPEKGIPTLIKAWHLIGTSLKCKLILVGDGDFRAGYEAMAAGLGVDFVGKQPNEVVRSMIAESKAVILPSECWEGMPITVLESFAEGTPCIVSNLGALPEMVKSGELGEVFEAGNPDSLAVAVNRLLLRPDYSKVCIAVRNEAMTKYSEEANYKRLMEIYGKVANV